MHTFEYPGKKPFFVSKETLEKTPYTFHTQNGIWEPESIDYFYRLVDVKHKNKNAVIVDVGAQSGLYSLYAKYLPNCKFLAFEPFPETFDLLKENLRLNGIDNVTAFPYALGSKEETKILYVPEHLGLNTLGSNPVWKQKSKEVSVTVKCLDDILVNESSFDYMKCDTEGWELHVLKGAEESICKWKPELVLEVFDLNLQQCSLKREDLYDYLHSLGYKEVKFLPGENAHFSYDNLNNS